MYSKNVQVPHEFFKKSKNEYSDWRMAFFRELIQNSVDAKARNIYFSIFENDNNTFTVQCTDDGKGMNENIILNKLLCLGGSHKEDGDVGGFGYAKTLLFFAHKKYTIHSREHIVNGSGGSFDIEKADEHINGTSINVIIPNERSYVSAESFKFELEHLIHYASFKTNIFLNGKALDKNFNKFKFNLETPIGTLKFNDTSDDHSELWVRIKGIPMFRHYIFSNSPSHFSGVIELDKKSTDVLTSNRDSLKNQARIEFNKIFTSLQNERSSLKSSVFESFVLNPVDIQNNTEEDEPSEPEPELKKEPALETVKNQSIQGHQLKPEKVSAEFNPFSKIRNNSEAKKNKLEEFMSKVNNENYSENFCISISESHMTHGQIKDELNKARNYKLADEWNTIVRSILHSLYLKQFGVTYENDHYWFNDKPIHTGFHFSHNELAVNSSSQEGYKILVNPIDCKERLVNMKYRKMIDLAIHEVAHLFTDNHDESFCSIENEIKEIFYDTQDLIDVNIQRLNH